MNESMLWLLRDTGKAKKQGMNAIKERQRTRLAEIVAFARANSPYYRELYKDLPERIEDTTLLPITSKMKLMPRFNDWCTDRNVTFDKVSAFVDNPDLIGKRFLEKYTITTTSGITRTRGIFLLNDRSLAVASSIAFRMMSSWIGKWDVVRIIPKPVTAMPPPRLLTTILIHGARQQRLARAGSCRRQLPTMAPGEWSHTVLVATSPTGYSQSYATTWAIVSCCGLPLARVPGINIIQILQTTPTNLRVRLRPATGAA